ncbi:MAG TPA: hypothetical protein VFX59_15320 [Polyangiales bacterium]|nr:hypothetical protein [Polyangiales bacterium]
MNAYGAQAKKHWAKWLPNRYSEIKDPETFFAELGEEIASEVDQMADALAGQDPLKESFLDKMGRLSSARQQAEERILREMALLDPENTPDASTAE